MSDKKILEIMETHVRNNEIKLLRLHLGMEKVIDTSERTEAIVSEMVDDVATLRTKVAHLEDDIEELKNEPMMTTGKVYGIAGVVVGAAITVALAVLEVLR